MRATAGALLAVAAALCLAAPASAFPVHVLPKLGAGRSVHLRFRAPALPEGGYYYAVIVLEPYGHFTRASPPPCSTSSEMRRTDYGRPLANGTVTLTLAPATSTLGRWCRGGWYRGAIYAVPQPPPCEGSYPCASEPYEPPSPCSTSPGGQRLCGLVVNPEWAYPDGLPKPRASGARIVSRFIVRFAAHKGAG